MKCGQLSANANNPWVVGWYGQQRSFSRHLETLRRFVASSSPHHSPLTPTMSPSSEPCSWLDLTRPSSCLCCTQPPPAATLTRSFVQWTVSRYSTVTHQKRVFNINGIPYCQSYGKLPSSCHLGHVIIPLFSTLLLTNWLTKTDWRVTLGLTGMLRRQIQCANQAKVLTNNKSQSWS